MNEENLPLGAISTALPKIPVWTMKYDNDVGPYDEGFWEFYDILRDGSKVARCNDEEEATEMIRKLNEYETKFRLREPN